LNLKALHGDPNQKSTIDVTEIKIDTIV